MTVRTAPTRADRRAQQAAERRARRALAIDVAMAAALAAIALSVAAGLGVIAFFGVPILLVGLLWIGVEKLVSHMRRRKRLSTRAAG